MRWSYEPEGVTLPDGENYLPDLLLPHLNTWVEVKGPHNQRIQKPELLAHACLHAPGCQQGQPVSILARPDGASAAGCACGWGDDAPWMLVVIARPNNAGRAVFETPHNCYQDRRLAVVQCQVCGQRSWHLVGGVPVCRRCHQLLSDPIIGWASGQLGFVKIEPPRGGGHTRRR